LIPGPGARARLPRLRRSRRRAIPTKKKKPGTAKRPTRQVPAPPGTSRKAPRSKAPASAKAGRKATPKPLRKAAARSTPRSRLEQPLGVGVGDSFAVRRLKVPPGESRTRPQSKVREISWAEFGEVARLLGEHIAGRFKPDVVLGVVNGGVFVGGALAPALGAEFHPVRFSGAGKMAPGDRLPPLAGKKVLAVDDVTVSGKTLGGVCKVAQQAGATEVRTAALVMRPGQNRPDFFAMETDDVVVFGWDLALNAPDAGSGDPGDVGV
jgi:hypoxanthine phosphoribosyltransferase